MDRRAFVAGLGALLATPVVAATTRGQDGRIPIIDTHAHPMRGLHRRSGVGSASALLQVMDEFLVEQAVLLPPPFPEGQSGIYGRREIESLLRGGHGRLAIAAGGESLNPTMPGTPADHVSIFAREPVHERQD